MKRDPHHFKKTIFPRSPALPPFTETWVTCTSVRRKVHLERKGKALGNVLLEGILGQPLRKLKPHQLTGASQHEFLAKRTFKEGFLALKDRLRIPARKGLRMTSEKVFMTLLLAGQKSLEQTYRRGHGKSFQRSTTLIGANPGEQCFFHCGGGNSKSERSGSNQLCRPGTLCSS